MPSFDLGELVTLLDHSENDQRVLVYFGESLCNMELDPYYGILAFEDDGVDVIFEEALWVLPTDQITDPKEMFICAFHFHSAGHEGHAKYRGKFPNAVAFGDSRPSIIDKLGSPDSSGGGEMLPILRRPAPNWLKYGFNCAILHLQLDKKDRLEMVTLMSRRAEA